jgi:hypothetical protein
MPLQSHHDDEQIQIDVPCPTPQPDALLLKRKIRKEHWELGTAI